MSINLALTLLILSSAYISYIVVNKIIKKE